MTIGYGHTMTTRSDKRYSQDDVDDLLKKDIRHVQSVIDETVKVPLNSQQQQAIESLIYNIGANTS